MRAARNVLRTNECGLSSASVRLVNDAELEKETVCHMNDSERVREEEREREKYAHESLYGCNVVPRRVRVAFNSREHCVPVIRERICLACPPPLAAAAAAARSLAR